MNKIRTFQSMAIHKTENKVRIASCTLNDGNGSRMTDLSNVKGKAGILASLLESVLKPKGFHYHIMISEVNLDNHESTEVAKEAAILPAGAFKEATRLLNVKFLELIKKNIPDETFYKRDISVISEISIEQGGEGLALASGYSLVSLEDDKKKPAESVPSPVQVQPVDNTKDKLRDGLKKMLDKYTKEQVLEVLKDHRETLISNFGQDLVDELTNELK